MSLISILFTSRIYSEQDGLYYEWLYIYAQPLLQGQRTIVSLNAEPPYQTIRTSLILLCRREKREQKPPLPAAREPPTKPQASSDPEGHTSYTYKFTHIKSPASQSPRSSATHPTYRFQRSLPDFSSLRIRTENRY